ncbi:MAG: ACP S-malonyltransferase [Planctomycetaceae bacterium]|nr:ACP S-malonyltransferase [Planctomycetaceae bacterium]
MENALKQGMGSSVFAFRGYNVTNIGKTPELLAHDEYGPIVTRHLREAGQICSDVEGKRVNLVARAKKRQNTTLKTYGRALASIVAIELAHIEILETYFDIKYTDAKMVVGYSLGEITALIAGGVYSMEDALRVLLEMAKDAAKLASNVSMGVLFSRGASLDTAAVERLCLEISSQGDGVISISTFLSPNTVLLLGQGKTVDEFKRHMKGHEAFPKGVHLRKNPHRWPPLHTILARQQNISNRASVMLDTVDGGLTTPDPPILSCITGGDDYTQINSREMICKWIDQPQKLWDVVHQLISSDVTRVIHIGPEPNIIPATLNRLVIDVTSQMNAKSLSSLGLRAMSQIARKRPWLTQLISSDASLLRAPFVEQIVLEDWLLERSGDGASAQATKSE